VEKKQKKLMKIFFKEEEMKAAVEFFHLFHGGNEDGLGA
jgi:hypothetical protein